MKKNFLLVVFLILLVLVPIFAGGSSATSRGDPTQLNIIIRNIGSAISDDNLINRELERRTGLKLS